MQNYIIIEKDANNASHIKYIHDAYNFNDSVRIEYTNTMEQAKRYSYIKAQATIKVLNDQSNGSYIYDFINILQINL